MAGISFFDSKECSWKDLRVFVEGVEVIKITALKYGVKAEKEHLHAAGDEPIGVQTGNRTYTGSITLLLGAFNDLNAAAIAAGGRDVTDISFGIVASYKKQGSRAIQIDKLVSVEISEFEISNVQNQKKNEVMLPILFMGLE